MPLMQPPQAEMAHYTVLRVLELLKKEEEQWLQCALTAHSLQQKLACRAAADHMRKASRLLDGMGYPEVPEKGMVQK